MPTKVSDPAGTSYDLSDPKDMVMKVAGIVVASTLTLWAIMTSANRGVPALNAVLSIIPGVDLTSDDSGNGDNLLGEL